jgi:hypothetical protein
LNSEVWAGDFFSSWFRSRTSASALWGTAQGPDGVALFLDVGSSFAKVNICKSSTGNVGLKAGQVFGLIPSASEGKWAVSHSDTHAVPLQMTLCNLFSSSFRGFVVILSAKDTTASSSGGVLLSSIHQETMEPLLAKSGTSWHCPDSKSVFRLLTTRECALCLLTPTSSACASGWSIINKVCQATQLVESGNAIAVLLPLLGRDTCQSF